MRFLAICKPNQLCTCVLTKRGWQLASIGHSQHHRQNKLSMPQPACQICTPLYFLKHITNIQARSVALNVQQTLSFLTSPDDLYCTSSRSKDSLKGQSWTSCSFDHQKPTSSKDKRTTLSDVKAVMCDPHNICANYQILP